MNKAIFDASELLGKLDQSDQQLALLDSLSESKGEYGEKARERLAALSNWLFSNNSSLVFCIFWIVRFLSIMNLLFLLKKFLFSQDEMKMPQGWIFVLGLVFGPIAYIAGESIGAIKFNPAYNFNLIIVVIAIVWGLSFPLLCWISNRMRESWSKLSV